jgi:hypothetical protein
LKGVWSRSWSGEGASVGQVVLLGPAQDGFNESMVASQGEAQSLGATKNGPGASANGRVFRAGWGIDERVFESQSALESEEGGVGEVDDDDLGGDEQSIELSRGHRFFALGAGFGFGDWANTSRKSFSSSRGRSRSAQRRAARRRDS